MVTLCEPEEEVEETPGPDTLQFVVLAELHERVTVFPIRTREVDSEIELVGCSTVTVVFAEVEPPAPVHVI